MLRIVCHFFGALTSDCGGQNGDFCFAGQCAACIRDLNKDLIETIPPHCTHPELTLALTGVKHHLLIN